ncbi:MAG: molybdopterin molybdotransferase MoeA [Cytophagaceae bacterium]|nr:molybdopterin molybdotransferase MoeA [Cytophagaceae bacterium]
MISPQAALKIVLNTILPNKVEKILLEDAFGRTLAEDLIADRPFPPFDRVTMDGIAINFQEFEKGKREFEILGIQTAGEAPIGAKNNSGCIEIMTGAMLPDGFDTVIRYEDLKIFGGIANVISEKIKPGQNIHYKGSDATLGQVIVEKSTKINAAIMAVAATIGKLELLVTSNPRIIILATGDELVQVNQTPKDYQIRASNTWAISSILKKEGFDAEMCLLKDEPQILEREIFQMLQKYDVLIFSGGVSMGKKDYLPEILASLGIKNIFIRFHKSLVNLCGLEVLNKISFLLFPEILFLPFYVRLIMYFPGYKIMWGKNQKYFKKLNWNLRKIIPLTLLFLSRQN